MERPAGLLIDEHRDVIGFGVLRHRVLIRTFENSVLALIPPIASRPPHAATTRDLILRPCLTDGKRIRPVSPLLDGIPDIIGRGAIVEASIALVVRNTLGFDRAGTEGGERRFGPEPEDPL